MKGFDKHRCLGNIYAIAKEKGIKIGDLEKNAGVSTGYLARLSKDGNKSNPGIDIILKMANELDVPITVLLNVDYNGMNTTEKYVYDFIRRLIDQTEQAELEWHVTSGLELENLWNSPIEGTFFAEEDNPYGLKQDDYQPIIVTDDEKKQEDLQFLPFGETYWLSTGEDTWLYIVSYVNTKFWQPEHLDMYFLFQRYDENNYSHIIKKNVFSTKERNGTVVECFRTLYKQIGVYMKQLHLDSDVKDEIDAFMSRTDPEAHFKVSRNDSKTAINVDDEIPF